MTEQGEQFNRFAFVVDKKSNKIQIKKAIEDMYDVSVDSIELWYVWKEKEFVVLNQE